MKKQTAAAGSIRFQKIGEVVHTTGLSRAQIYRLARAGLFPRPVKTGIRSSAWVEGQVMSWCEARIAESLGEQESSS